MLPEFRYFSKNVSDKIDNIPKSLFNYKINFDIKPLLKQLWIKKMAQIHFSIGWLVTKFKGKGATLVCSLIALLLDNHLITNIWANLILNIVIMEEASDLIESTVKAQEALRSFNKLNPINIKFLFGHHIWFDSMIINKIIILILAFFVCQSYI